MSDPVVIRCRDNGPLVIQGPFRLVDHLGNAFELTLDGWARRSCYMKLSERILTPLRLLM